MLNKTKKCVSKCINLPKEKCYKGCVYTRKKYCKLSSKYKMDPKRNCALVLNLQKLDKTPKLMKIPKKEIVYKKSYSPEVNNFLIQSRNSPKYDIFNAISQCMNIDINSFTFEDSILKYYKNPKIKLKNGECVSYWNENAQKLFLDNLSKHNIIDINTLLGPKQSYHNCWFNTGFMINYISDKGRKFNKYFRQYMITGKSPNLKPFIKKLRPSLFLLNMAIEATLQGNPIAEIMDTNDIIYDIYQNIPKEFRENKYIFNIKEFGNPYLYQISLLNYISNKKNNYFINGKLFFENYKKYEIDYKNDILWIELSDKESNIHKIKEIIIKNKKYKLDSMLLRDKGQNHVCCFITLNNKEYIYDGANSPTIIEMNWKNKINDNKNFRISKNNIITWNMCQGYQVLNYYRV